MPCLLGLASFNYLNKFTMKRTSLLCLLLLGIVFSLSAQKAQFGIGLSVGHSNLTAGQSATAPNFSSVITEGKWGFSTSIYALIPLAGRLHLSVTPSIKFQNQSALFTLTDGTGPLQEDIQPATIALPIRLEMHSNKGAWRPVVAVGGGALFNLGQTEESNLDAEKLTAFWEVSAGLATELERFTIRPEVYTRRSLGNVVRGVGDNTFNQALGDTDWAYIGFRILFYGNS